MLSSLREPCTLHLNCTRNHQIYRFGLSQLESLKAGISHSYLSHSHKSREKDSQEATLLRCFRFGKRFYRLQLQYEFWVA